MNLQQTNQGKDALTRDKRHQAKFVSPLHSFLSDLHDPFLNHHQE